MTEMIKELRRAGFTHNETRTLVRLSRRLHRWYELKCGNEYGYIERDDSTGVPYWCSSNGRIRVRVYDDEAETRNHIEHIVSNRNARRPGDPLRVYIQSDPRGASLYLIREGDVHYTSGICVY